MRAVVSRGRRTIPAVRKSYRDLGSASLNRYVVGNEAEVAGPGNDGALFSVSAVICSERSLGCVRHNLGAVGGISGGEPVRCAVDRIVSAC